MSFETILTTPMLKSGPQNKVTVPVETATKQAAEMEVRHPGKNGRRNTDNGDERRLNGQAHSFPGARAYIQQQILDG